MVIVELGFLEMDEKANGEIQAFGQQQHISATDMGPQPGLALTNCVASGNVVIALSFFFLICKVPRALLSAEEVGVAIWHLGVEEKASFQAVEPSHLSESNPGPNLYIFISLNSVTLE